MTRHPRDMAHRPEADPTPLEVVLGGISCFLVLLVVVIAFALAPA